MNKQQAPAVLIVGHGSRDVDAVREFLGLADAIGRQLPERHCSTGFLEFATPTIDTAAAELVEAGATRITAIPGMLMAAGHAKNDIPSEVNALAAQYPGVEFQYGTELGVHAKMLRVARERIEQAEQQLGDDYRREDTLLLVVGRGASDPDANSNICKITRMLWEGMGFAWAETCFSGVTTPRVDAALQRVPSFGLRNLIVFPYFLFTGRLVKDRIYAPTDEFAAANPAIRVAKAHYLDAHPLVIESFLDRLHDTEAGTGNMNCQLCQYREQIVGFEDHQGQAQVGHHHHVRGIGTDDDHHHHDHDHHHHHHGDKG